jgi:hypothetical protein
MARMKKELTTGLVISAALKGFRAIDAGKALSVSFKKNHVGSVKYE